MGLIEFRGKSLEDNEWKYGYYVQDDSGNCEIICYENNREIRHAVDSSTVGQYIGKEAGNGEKIFEGDIFEGTHGWVSVVEYSASNARYWGRCLYQHFVPESRDSHVKIIGNIHDNRELLNK